MRNADPIETRAKGVALVLALSAIVAFAIRLSAS